MGRQPKSDAWDSLRAIDGVRAKVEDGRRLRDVLDDFIYILDTRYVRQEDYKVRWKVAVLKDGKVWPLNAECHGPYKLDECMEQKSPHFGFHVFRTESDAFCHDSTATVIKVHIPAHADEAGRGMVAPANCESWSRMIVPSDQPVIQEYLAEWQKEQERPAPKFKVGDYVEVVGPMIGPCDSRHNIGRKGKVVRINNYGAAHSYVEIESPDILYNAVEGRDNLLSVGHIRTFRTDELKLIP